jgi:hypothetical protein
VLAAVHLDVDAPLLVIAIEIARAAFGVPAPDLHNRQRQPVAAQLPQQVGLR